MEKITINSTYVNAMLKSIMAREGYVTADDALVALLSEHIENNPPVVANECGLYSTQAVGTVIDMMVE